VRRTLLVLALLLGATAVALALGATSDSGTERKSYEIVFDNAFGLTEGGDFKVAGVRVGTTGELRVIRGRRPLALVRAEVSEPGFGDLRADARCEIRPQSFIGEYFVDCQPGTSDRRLPDGGRVPVRQTSSTIPIDLVNDILRRPYAERLRIVIGELGAGLAGRPEDLAEVLRRAHPGLRETSETLRVLGHQTRTIRRFVRDADTVVAALERRKRDVTRFVGEAGRTAEIAASRRAELARTFDLLPDFLRRLDPLMLRLGEVADAQVPLLRDLRAGSDELDVFLGRLEPFTETGRPALRSLGEAALVGRRAVRETEAELDELRRLASEAPGLAKPLRQLLETIDDRRRAVEPDPRAAATSPPAPDKTHVADASGGFTGMEAIWNYFFWQALSTNALDDIGHVLRVGITVDLPPTGCSGYFKRREGNEEVFDRCNQWLGPYQPGINAPDPTEGGSGTAASASAPATPTIAAPATPAPAKAADNSLLDFLLGP
jgi:ABC-type transporter Mla subunit MlaD